MRNLLLIAFAFALLVPAEQALAGGGGGGKAPSSAEIFFTNVEPATGSTFVLWVRPVGTPVPATFGALRSMLITVQPGDAVSTGRLQNGLFAATLVDAADVAGIPNSATISQAQVDALTIDTDTILVSGVDIGQGVSNAGGIFDNSSLSGGSN